MKQSNRILTVGIVKAIAAIKKVPVSDISAHSSKQIHQKTGIIVNVYQTYNRKIN